MHAMTNIAVRAARQAGKMLLRYYNRLDQLTVSEKSENEFVSEADKVAEDTILAIIRKAYPDHAILAEEAGKNGQDDYLWIIDPLDGTTNYLHGFPQFAISIALEHRGKLMCGVVYDPLRDELFIGEQGKGAYLNDRRIRVSARKGLAGALLGTGIPYRDRRFIDTYLAMLKVLVVDTAGIRRPGSAALDLAYVAAGRIDGFWELGLAPWDFAAGTLLIREAGGVVSDLSGGHNHFETGNLIAGGVRIHNQLLRKISPFLSDQLAA